MAPPPPVNASNLNDISNALQAVNITQQERTALGAQANDTLGQVLEAVTSTLQQYTQQQCSNLQTLIWNNYSKFIYGSYVGAGQPNLTISYQQNGIDTTDAKIAILFRAYSSSELYGIPFSFVFNCTNGGLCYVLDSRSSGSGYLYYGANFSNGNITINADSNFGASMNIRNITYNYIIFS